jgi:hypothetical protein
MNFPETIRIHVTKRDTIRGCLRFPCALDYPVQRFFSKFGYFAACGFSVIEVYKDSSPDLPETNIVAKYRATDEHRMVKFTKNNDAGVVQKPTSFTFKRVF